MVTGTIAKNTIAEPVPTVAQFLPNIAEQSTVWFKILDKVDPVDWKNHSDPFLGEFVPLGYKTSVAELPVGRILLRADSWDGEMHYKYIVIPAHPSGQPGADEWVWSSYGTDHNDDAFRGFLDYIENLALACAQFPGENLATFSTDAVVSDYHDELMVVTGVVRDLNPREGDSFTYGLDGVFVNTEHSALALPVGKVVVGSKHSDSDDETGVQWRWAIVPPQYAENYLTWSIAYLYHQWEPFREEIQQALVAQALIPGLQSAGLRATTQQVKLLASYLVGYVSDKVLYDPATERASV